MACVPRKNANRNENLSETFFSDLNGTKIVINIAKNETPRFCFVILKEKKGKKSRLQTSEFTSMADKVPLKTVTAEELLVAIK